MLPIIEREARKVRRWALDNGAPDDLYCWCAICSVELFKRLTARNLKVEFVMTHSGWEYHCFLLWNDYIVDVTASQFCNDKKMRIFEKEKGKGNWFWDMRPRYASIYSDIKEIEHALNSWPDEQNPFKRFGECG